MSARDRIERAQELLDYRFRDPALLERALVHGSLCAETGAASNETLEFLGDAVIDLVVSEALMQRHPEWDEGRLSRARAATVSAPSLASIARDLRVGSIIRLGRGEEASGGRSKARILASAYEALIGAVFCDGGYDAAKRLVTAHMNRLLDEDRSTFVDYKTRLQELLQARYKQRPTYRTVASRGPDHARRFEAVVELEGRSLARGEGSTRKAAEQAAAARALAALDEGRDDERTL